MYGMKCAIIEEPFSHKKDGIVLFIRSREFQDNCVCLVTNKAHGAKQDIEVSILFLNFSLLTCIIMKDHSSYSTL
ncbi:Uncharacterized protein TCM_013668 [Theobroma cacao]|uniref:Uncharacterized protein n=1 Tax=Theobroma cacao TaxID=3641 RepID=A0A061FVY8_THECC|nr:Uncharacterized protein TCM_013668 [Theobroma cacao]